MRALVLALMSLDAFSLTCVLVNFSGGVRVRDKSNDSRQHKHCDLQKGERVDKGYKEDIRGKVRGN
jgi:hypothetical protein